MVAGQTKQSTDQPRRAIVFRALAGVLSIGLLIAGLFEFIPAWIVKDATDQPHLWHIAELSALSIFLLGACMLGMLRKPEEKPLLAQFFVLSTIILAIGITPFNIAGLVLFPIGFVFTITYPDRAALLRVGRTGRLSLPLLGLSVVFAIFLDPVIHQEIYYQIIGMTNDIHAMLLHWIGSALLLILLIIAGVMASTKGRGWKWLTVIVGINFVFLGVISMIVPDYAGSWAQWCGLLSIFGGLLYFLMLSVEIERDKLRAAASVPEPTITEELYQVQQEHQLAKPHESDCIEL